VFPFLSAHHAYALARAGRADALAALQATVARRAAEPDAEATRVWRPIGQPVVEACAAHGLGRLADAAAAFEPVADRFEAIGGSDAQDDLFRQAHLVALARSGRTADARRWWQATTAFKVLAPLDERFLAGLGASG
jgi:hypothetical protein